MRPLTRRWPLLAAALAFGVVLTTSAPDLGSAETAPGAKAQAAALSRSESGALLELYAAESALASARASAAALARRSTALAEEEASISTRATIVRRSLRASQARVAALLRELYIQGDTDPISVILGATSLDEAVAGIDGLTRSAAQNRRLAVEASAKSRQLGQLATRLRAERDRLARAQAEADAGVRRLQAAVAGRSATVAEIRRKQSLTAKRIAALEQQAQAAQQASAKLTTVAAAPASVSADTTAATQAEAPPATTPSSPSGTRTLVVDAVAYHLPGKTASGLPVAVGVIAVDPNVIPLGTRVFVPGYGPAVAADVGTAIQGNIIDLWMPSTAAARAWGRRTVTITIYG